MSYSYSYENIELWDEKVWEERISPVFPLVKWIGGAQTLDDSPYHSPVNGVTGEACQSLDIYYPKTNSVAIPEVIDSWKERNVTYECRSQGGINWIIMAPTSCMSDYGKKLPTLVVFTKEDTTDPYWAMKTLEKYDAYNTMVSEDQDKIVVYLAAPGSDLYRVYVNILQEAFVFIPGDVKSVFLDVSTCIDAGISLSLIPDFIYQDAAGVSVSNPDAFITPFGSAEVPALDITGRWENACSLSRDQVSLENWSSPGFDLQRVIHSETGKRFAEGMALEYNYNSVYEEGFLEYCRNMGLKYVNHETDLRRWKIAAPLSAFEEPDKKLPVMCVFQEVNLSNEHLAVTSASYFYEYLRIAAQSECILLFFVLEDVESNELLVKILEEASQTYPMIDTSRVYLSGHSHNGYYSLEFAVRHPELIAGVATFGDVPGMQNTALFRLNEEKIAYMSTLDIPVINLVGYREPKRHFPMNADGDAYRPEHLPAPLATFKLRAESLQLRLKAFNCPMKSFEEIAATKDSPEKAIRMLGVPGDKSETLWLDGFEVYIVDIKNNEGKYHLRLVGEENMPHNTTPVQQDLSWSFLRRFARDQKTGKIIELY